MPIENAVIWQERRGYQCNSAFNLVTLAHRSAIGTENPSYCIAPYIEALHRRLEAASLIIEHPRKGHHCFRAGTHHGWARCACAGCWTADHPNTESAERPCTPFALIRSRNYVLACVSFGFCGQSKARIRYAHDGRTRLLISASDYRFSLQGL